MARKPLLSSTPIALVAILGLMPQPSWADITLQAVRDGISASVNAVTAAVGVISSTEASNKLQPAPGEATAPPSQDPGAPPPPSWTNIPLMETFKGATLNTQMLDESIFQLYGTNLLVPPPLAVLPPKSLYFSKHFAVYCAKKSAIETTAFSSCDANDNLIMQHAELKPSTLLEPHKYDAAESVAALEFIRTLVDPFAEKNIQPLLSDPAKLDDEGNKDKIIKALTRQAKLNVPVYSMLEAYSKRTAAPGMPSFMEILESEASKRYTNPAWHVALATGLSQEALLKDIAIMLANSLWVQKEQYKQQERLELLLSLNALVNLQAAGKMDEADEKAGEATQKVKEEHPT